MIAAVLYVLAGLIALAVRCREGAFEYEDESWVAALAVLLIIALWPVLLAQRIRQALSWRSRR